MVQQMTTTETVPGVIVSADEYMELFAGDFYEWVKGRVIKMSPVTQRHNSLTNYFANILEIYFTLNPIGTFLCAPFVLRMDAIEVLPLFCNNHSPVCVEIHGL